MGRLGFITALVIMALEAKCRQGLRQWSLLSGFIPFRLAAYTCVIHLWATGFLHVRSVLSHMQKQNGVVRDSMRELLFTLPPSNAMVYPTLSTFLLYTSTVPYPIYAQSTSSPLLRSTILPEPTRQQQPHHQAHSRPCP